MANQQNGRANVKTVKTLTITGLMTALTVLLSFPFFGTIMLPIVSVTVAFVPVMVTVMTVGFWPGFFVAAVAGITSMIRAWVLPATLLSPFIQNPVVSVFPRLLVAVSVFFTFRLLLRTKVPRGMAVAVAAV